MGGGGRRARAALPIPWPHVPTAPESLLVPVLVPVLLLAALGLALVAVVVHRKAGSRIRRR